MQATAILPPRGPRILPRSRMGDEALAGRAADGDEAAFATLCERYYDPLLGYCRSILLDDEDARDATQSALENALRALPRREPGRPLRPWLYRIAHNESINVVRRRQPIASGVDTDELLTVPGPEVDAEQRSRMAQLVDDLRTLPERQRGALVMRELSGLSYDEIGVALGVSNEAARRAVFDARSALHAAVDGRATECTSVRRMLSDGDRRHLRARGVRAHMRSCDDCATFEQAMGARQADLHLLGPWLGGSAALGLIGLGGGAGGSAIVAATGGGGAAAASGGGLWASLPVAVKGFAVAAAVATTGTAVVELPKVTTPDAPAPQSRAAANGAGPSTTSARNEALRERALAQAAAARRARRARAARRSVSNARLQSTATGIGSATAGPGSAARPKPATPAPATPAPATATPAPAVAHKPATSTPAPAAAKSPEQIAAESLQRIRDKVSAAFSSAQTVAGSGVQGALATANSIVQNTLNQVLPSINRILGSVGLSLPSSATPAAPSSTANTTVANILAPAQSLLGGVNSLLQNLFGRR